MECYEQDYGTVVAITAYPDSAAVFSLPLQVRRKDIAASEYTFTSSAAIRLPLHPFSARLTETSKDERGHLSYDVSLTWDILRTTHDIFEKLYEVQREFKHFVVETFGGKIQIIRSERDGYKFHFRENGEFLSCELSVHNINGVQREFSS